MIIRSINCLASILFFAAIGIFMLSACATTQQTEQRFGGALAGYIVEADPRVQRGELKGKLKRAALLRGSGEYNDEVARNLTGTTWPWKWVEREEVARVVEEQALGMTGLVEPTTAAQTGKLLGADHIITFNVMTSNDEAYSFVSRAGGQLSADIRLRIVNTETAGVVFQQNLGVVSRWPTPAPGRSWVIPKSDNRLWLVSIASTLLRDKLMEASDMPTTGIIFDPKYGGRGIMVLATVPGGAAHESGLKQGDVIVKVGDQEIRDLADFNRQRVLEMLFREPITVVRGGYAMMKVNLKW